MGLFDFFKKKAIPIKEDRPKDDKSSVSQPLISIEVAPQDTSAKHDTPPFEVIGEDNQRFSNYLVPAKIKDAGKFLDRKIKLTYVDKNLAARALREKRWELKLSMVEGRVYAFSEGEKLGALPKSDISQEWLESGEPYIAILEQVNREKGYRARIVLYCNKVKHYCSHEQTIVGLTGYKSARFQENGEYIPLDSELYAREDNDYLDKVIVFYDGQPIGFLPKKESKLFLDGNPVLTVFDHSESDDNGKSRPFVRIYW